MWKVYTGRKSPTNGINSARFMITDTLLLFIEYNVHVTIASKTSSVIGILNMGAAK